jgi:hypothetical protein
VGPAGGKEELSLAFCDLHIFNIAMLARQSWRLLKFPDSLCAKVLKAKYFPDCTVLEAMPKQGMSYTWRSILKGLITFERGHRLESWKWREYCGLGGSLAAARLYSAT